MTRVRVPKDSLREVAVMAADEQIRLLERLDWWERHGVAALWSIPAPGVGRMLPLARPLARLRRWLVRWVWL